MRELLAIQKQAEYVVQDMEFVEPILQKKTQSTMHSTPLTNQSSRSSALHKEAAMEVDEEPMNAGKARMTKRGRHKRGDTLKILDDIIMQEAANGSFRLNTEIDDDDRDDEGFCFEPNPLTKASMVQVDDSIIGMSTTL